jgi:hypothetical protein
MADGWHTGGRGSVRVPDGRCGCARAADSGARVSAHHWSVPDRRADDDRSAVLPLSPLSATPNAPGTARPGYHIRVSGCLDLCANRRPERGDAYPSPLRAQAAATTVGMTSSGAKRTIKPVNQCTD